MIVPPIPLWISFSNTNYAVNVTPTEGGTTVVNVISRNNDKFTVKYQYSSTLYSRNGLWIAIGY